MAVLTTKAKEESTYIITASFYDEDNNAITPKSATWTLTDDEGNVINSRENVSIAVPATSNDIVLSGDDLGSVEDYGTERHLLIHAVYDSDAGSNLPLNDEVIFTIYDIVAVE